MDEIGRLLHEVEEARSRILDRVASFEAQALHARPDPDAWSVAEVIEHLARAEEYGLRGLWGVVERLDRGDAVQELDPALARRSIAEVFAGAPERIDAPTAVVPSHEGRPAGYWLARLRGNEALLAELGQAIRRVGLGRVVYPHFMAGPLGGRQRLQFFRWHMDRHLGQIDRRNR